MELVEILGIVVSLLSILGLFVKVLSTFNEFVDAVNRRNQEQDHEIEKLLLIINGVRERLEHVTTRLQNYTTDNSRKIEQLSRYLTKTTDFEPKD